MHKKVTIELTPEQKDRIKSETGEDVKDFTYEALESRDAPKGNPGNISQNLGTGDKV